MIGQIYEVSSYFAFCFWIERGLYCIVKFQLEKQKPSYLFKTEKPIIQEIRILQTIERSGQSQKLMSRG